MTLHRFRNGLVVTKEIADRIYSHQYPVQCFGPWPSLRGVCPNCGGSKWVVVRLLRPVDNERKPITFYSNKVFNFDELTLPCPVCSGDNGLENALRERAGLEPEEWNWRIDFGERDPEKRAAIEAAGHLLAKTPHPSGWLVIYGKHSMGKSGLLKAMVAALVKAGVDARYLVGAALLTELRSTFGAATGEHESELIERFCSHKFLAIDEVNRIQGSRWEMDRLFQVLNARYDRRFSIGTALTTNSMPGEFGPEWSYLEERLKDGVRVVMGGEALRGAAGRKFKFDNDVSGRK